MWDDICRDLSRAGAITPQTYAQVIGDFRGMGYAGAPERPHGNVPARFLVEKVRGLQDADDSDDRAGQVRQILTNRGVL